ncbi:MAG: GNAT family N-acetyltransferase [Melioribacteraceae bacterium]|nr:GNAT family N-acetyltransferase [Melioribacteraceae bacterium]
MDKQKKVISNYRNNEILRNAFDTFISEVFPGISFKEWYKRGFWTGSYQPFSIIKSGKIVSSASAAFMDIIINHKKKYKAIQLGAVGTLPEYRNQGLSRHIIDLIIKKYRDEVDFFFLYANKTVPEFYPKFGFKKAEEYSFSIESAIPTAEYSPRILNLSDVCDFKLIKDMVENRRVLTKIFGAENYGFITMWHILNLYHDKLFYLEDENAVIIKLEKENTIHIIDVIYKESFAFDSALPKIICSEAIKSVKYYFPPDQINYSYENVVKEDTYLFILGNVALDENYFRFPTTAIT